MRKRLLLAAMTICLVGFPHGSFAIETIDQENTVGGSLFFQNGAGSSIGQSFNPALSSVSVASFSLLTDDTASVQLQLFQGSGYAGTLLGSSAPVTVSNAVLESTEFYFSTAIALIPGNPYTLRLVLLSGEYEGAFSNANPYGGGTAFDGAGSSNPGMDLVFAEGIPEPTSLGLAVLGGMILWWRRARPGAR